MREIPYPTITDWEMGNRRIPEYLLRLLAYKVRVEKESLRQIDSNKIKGNGNLLISELTKDKITDEIVDKILFDGMEDCNENADCIIVLGSIKASQYRISIAAEAYQKKRALKLLLCGGKVREFPEGTMKESEHMYRRAIELGVKIRRYYRGELFTKYGGKHTWGLDGIAERILVKSCKESSAGNNDISYEKESFNRQISVSCAYRSVTLSC